VRARMGRLNAINLHWDLCSKTNDEPNCTRSWMEPRRKRDTRARRGLGQSHLASLRHSGEAQLDGDEVAVTDEEEGCESKEGRPASASS